MKRKKLIIFFSWRFHVVIAILILVFCALAARMIYLTIFDRSFLEHQSDVRTLRTINTPAFRGMIISADNVPLAMSIPVDEVSINPQDFPASNEHVRELANLLGFSTGKIWEILQQNRNRFFVYLKRDVNAEVGDKIQALHIRGVYLDRQYHRYYPQGEITSHIVGFTNIDDEGQEGLELAYNNWLKGTAGKKQVLKDRLGHMVAEVGTIEEAKPGNNLVLSINSRIQFLAYHVLKETIDQYQAQSGTVIVLDPRTGEILALVNQPDFDPNLPHTPPYNRYRNRAVTDTYEPGSTLKVFSIANAIESGHFTADTLINTAPGWFMIGRHEVRDEHNNGVLTVTQILAKSSNVGVAKMTLTLGPDHLLEILRNVGFGQSTLSGMPGENAGSFPHPSKWPPFDVATLAFGYGIGVTPLQIVHAYSAVANNGKQCPITVLKSAAAVNCQQVLNPRTANIMLKMMEAVLAPGGSATEAVVPGYRVAGKTGTAGIAGAHGYGSNDYVSSFVGIAPVSHPRLLIAVMIRQPTGVHLGGFIAAPAFSKIMAGALRILNIPPDAVS